MKLDKFKFTIITVTLVLCTGILGYYGYLHISRRIAYNKLAEEVTSSIKQFPGTVGVYIKDLRTGATIKFNENKLLPSASLVKIPIMAAVFQAINDGNLSLDKEIVLRKKHKVGGSGKLRRYRSGRKFTVKKLVELMITESDNTATNMLTDLLGFSYINHLFQNKLNLESTNLERSIMDLKARRKGRENYTTAKEIGELLEKIYHGKIINKETSFKMLNILLRQKSKDRIPRLLPKGLPIAHKTGFMRDTCHDAGIIFTSKGDFVVCVLTDNVKSIRLAKILIGDIAYKTYQYY